MKLKTSARSMERAQKRTQGNITLLSFCAAQLMKTPLAADVVLYNTIGERVLCSNLDADLDLMQPCNHEEADTRSFLHLKYASSKGHKKAFLRTNDTDWVVNASYVYPKLPELDELWIGYGTGKTYRDIPIHDSSSRLGEQRCEALPYSMT